MSTGLIVVIGFLAALVFCITVFILSFYGDMYSCKNGKKEWLFIPKSVWSGIAPPLFAFSIVLFIVAIPVVGLTPIKYEEQVVPYEYHYGDDMTVVMTDDKFLKFYDYKTYKNIKNNPPLYRIKTINIFGENFNTIYSFKDEGGKTY